MQLQRSSKGIVFPDGFYFKATDLRQTVRGGCFANRLNSGISQILKGEEVRVHKARKGLFKNGNEENNCKFGLLFVPKDSFGTQNKFYFCILGQLQKSGLKIKKIRQRAHCNRKIDEHRQLYNFAAAPHTQARADSSKIQEQLHVGRRRYLVWQGEGAPRKMMSQEIIFPARIRSESLRMRKFEDSEINDGHHCAVFKKVEGVNTVYYSSHLSKKKSHSLNIHFFPSPVVEIGDTMLNEIGVVSEDKRVSSFSYHGVSCPEIFTERPGKGFAYAHLSWLCSPVILPHTLREAYFKGDRVHKRRVHRKKKICDRVLRRPDHFTRICDVRK